MLCGPPGAVERTGIPFAGVEETFPAESGTRAGGCRKRPYAAPTTRTRGQEYYRDRIFVSARVETLLPELRCICVRIAQRRTCSGPAGGDGIWASGCHDRHVRSERLRDEWQGGDHCAGEKRRSTSRGDPVVL